MCERNDQCPRHPPFRGNNETRVTDANGNTHDVHVGYSVWAGAK